MSYLSTALDCGELRHTLSQYRTSHSSIRYASTAQHQHTLCEYRTSAPYGTARVHAMGVADMT
eukprot:2245719-Rhodomonas_salina.4